MSSAGEDGIGSGDAVPSSSAITTSLVSASLKTPNLMPPPPPPPPTSPTSKYSPQTPPPRSASSRNANALSITSTHSTPPPPLPPRPTSPSGSSVCTSKSGISNSPRPPAHRRGVNSNNSGGYSTTIPAATSVATANLPAKSIMPGLSRSSSYSSIPRSAQGKNAAAQPSEQELTAAFDTIECKNAPNTPFLYDEFMLNADNSTTTRSKRFQPDPYNPRHRQHLPRPVHPTECPLLCVFYAEFDIVIGPRVCFQSPQKFMQLDVDVNIDEIHHALEETFSAVLPQKEEEKIVQDEMQKEESMARNDSENSNDTQNTQQHRDENEGSNSNGHPSIEQQCIRQQHDHDEYWEWSPSTKKPPIIERVVSDASTLRSLSFSGSKQNATIPASNRSSSADNMALNGTTTKAMHERSQSDSSTVHSSSHSRNPSYASASKSNHSNPNQQAPNITEGGGDTSTIDTELLQNSIFAATSEYIITGNELANRAITVSTHGMHILSRPKIICDTQRYERNSLLFAVGFVLRREANVDPRHFWPVLSKVSSTLYDMEVESEFLSNGRTRSQIQIILEDILISLNSKQMDCHLLLDNANLINLQLFHPPPPQAATPPVPDYAVPILLRPEWQLQMYDWDLTINWIVPHIDGCQYVKQIAASTEVDMEMVRACLRVLRHHGVLTHVDVFRYSNLYEFQGYDRLVTSGGGDGEKKKADAVKKVFTDAFWYSAKSKYVARNQLNNYNAPTFGNTPALPWASSKRTPNMSDEIASAPRSFPSLTGHFPMKKENPPDDDGIRSERLRCPDMKEIDLMTKALEQLFCSLSRDKSFGEVLLEKIGGMTDSSNAVTSGEKKHGDELDNKKGIDWNHVFNYIDHRRLITFGLLQGLIRRVHQYPLAYRIGTDEYESNRIGILREGNDFHCDVTGLELSAVVAEEVAPLAMSLPIEDRSMATSCSVSPSQSLFAPIPLSGRIEPLANKVSRKEKYVRSRNLLIEKVALAMNGTRCDDELSCIFDVPVEKLIEIVQSTGRWNVMCVHSCAD